MATLHFLWLSDIPVSVCVCLHTYLWHLACLHALGIVNSAAMNTGVHVSFWMRVFIFPGCLPESEVVGSDSSSIFSFLRKLHAVPHSGCSSSHSYQQGMKITVSTISSTLDLTNVLFFILMWIIFKDFFEFVTILLLFYILFIFLFIFYILAPSHARP